MIAKYLHIETFGDYVRKPRGSCLNAVQIKFIDDAMANKDELTFYNLKILTEKWPELQNISIPTIKRYRKKLGWVATKPHYCQN